MDVLDIIEITFSLFALVGFAGLFISIGIRWFRG